jgi:hypothetical protein
MKAAGIDLNSTKVRIYINIIVMKERSGKNNSRLFSRYLDCIVPMSVCANFEPNKPSRLAAYTGQHNAAQHITYAIVEKHNLDYRIEKLIA